MSSTTKTWVVEGQDGFDSLKFVESAIPELGSSDVLVKFHGLSLNYRDLAMPKGKYPMPNRDGAVPGSDGAGVVEAIGKDVTRFRPGDRVITLFNPQHLAGSSGFSSRDSSLGSGKDGTFREYGTFNEQGLVSLPSNLNFVEGATLTCAGLTAWNALYGLDGQRLKPGDWVLTQGTGGVSIFALQFAKAAGARVIATTSSAAKADRLKELGADHVINYKEDAGWGETAKKLAGGIGVQHVIEVGGPSTLAQSFKAVAHGAAINIIGFLAGSSNDGGPSFLDVLSNLATVRGVFVGSRTQFEDMNRAIEANNIKPVVDPQVFKLEELKEAYQYMWDQKHFGKVGVTVD